jgi:hemerythrin superfamily protein
MVVEKREAPMDAIKLLKQQHDLVEKLFAEYEDTDDGRSKRSIFMRIADNLAAHATIEEKIFYPAAYVGDLKDLLKEAVEEHLAAKRIIADLLDMSVSDENYDAKVKVLKEQIEHHVEEEEGEMFGKVEKTLDEARLRELGAEMEEMFADLMADAPSAAVPDETAEAAPLE